MHGFSYAGAKLLAAESSAKIFSGRKVVHKAGGWKTWQQVSRMAGDRLQKTDSELVIKTVKKYRILKTYYITALP